MAELLAKVCDVVTYTGFGNKRALSVRTAILSITPLEAGHWLRCVQTGDDCADQGAGKEFNFCAEHAKLYLSTLIDRPENVDDAPVMQMGGGTGAELPMYPQANAEYDAEGNLRVSCPGAVGVPGNVIDEEPYDDVLDVDKIEAESDIDEAAHDQKDKERVTYEDVMRSKDPNWRTEDDIDLNEDYNRKVAGKHVDDDEPIYDRTKEDNDTEAAAEEERAKTKNDISLPW